MLNGHLQSLKKIKLILKLLSHKLFCSKTEEVINIDDEKSNKSDKISEKPEAECVTISPGPERL